MLKMLESSSAGGWGGGKILVELSFNDTEKCVCVFMNHHKFITLELYYQSDKNIKE